VTADWPARPLDRRQRERRGGQSRGVRVVAIVPGAGMSVISGAGTGGDNERLAVSLYRTICGPISLGAFGAVIDRHRQHHRQWLDLLRGRRCHHGSRINLQTSTVFGTVGGQILNASDTIFTGLVTVERQQSGCARFCYVPLGSRTPRRYRCQNSLESFDSMARD
jgi:hypothetical protein